jgi:chaperone modulatory protein CbpM
METQEFIGRSHLDIPTLNAWVEAEWLMPVTSRTKFLFSEADLARARLIQDLKVDFGVNDEGISIVLHLLDQLYGAGYSRDGNARSRHGCRLTGGEAAARFGGDFKRAEPGRVVVDQRRQHQLVGMGLGDERMR